MSAVPPIDNRASLGAKRRLAIWGLRRSGLRPALLGRTRWRGVLVLAYHRVLPAAEPGRYPGTWSATPEGFAEQIELLATHSDVVPLSAVPRLHDASGRHVAITFDDGYRDNHQWALPVLRAYDLPATVFVASGLVDGTAMPWWDELAWLYGGLGAAGTSRWPELEDAVRDYWAAADRDAAQALIAEVATLSDRPRLTAADVRDEWMTWAMIREMQEAGVEIGAHTATHPLLAQLDPEAQRDEIAGNADRIAEQTGRRPTALAYPVGTRAAFDEQTKAAARAAGIETAYSLYGGPTTASADRWDPYDIRRVGIEIRNGRDDLAALLALPQVFGQKAEPVAPDEQAQPDDAKPARRAERAVRPWRPRRRPAADERIRTMTLVDRLVHGGAERMAYLLTRELDPDRFARTICVTTAGDPKHAAAGTEPATWPDDLRDAGVRVIELDRARRSDPRGWGPLITELRGTDVLHAHMFTPGVCAAVLGPSVGVPVTIAHEHAWAHTGGRRQPLIERRVVAPRCTAMIACSVAVRDRMVEQDGLPADRVVVLPNGIVPRSPTPARDVRSELGIPAGAPLVGSVGALREIKRFDVLIDAIDRVRRQRPDVRLLIAGDGDERTALEQQIARLGLEDVVRLLGARSDVPDVAAALDVAVSSSDSEASPLAVMEYMEGGRAIVATRVGGVPELIEDGVHGRLVPRRDPDAMAAAIVALLDAPEDRARLGAAAHQRCKDEFRLDVMVDRLERFYERLVAHRDGGSGRSPRR
ncbi:MAG: glycosyltransferase [Patulibacter sp.]|nr:glycosyltransferase [Patulibacter sp.]